ncbi:MAG: AI-2E family transporter [Nitrospirae bacterium]|nr:AI-2E family transporter [Nitrospirota bacterium]
MTVKKSSASGPNAWRVDLWVFVLLAAVFLVVYEAGETLTPFVFAALFAYALNPAVAWMTRRKVPRGAAVGLFVLLFFVAISAAVAGAAYVIQAEVGALIRNLPGYMETVETKYMPMLAERLGVEAPPSLRELGDSLRERLMHISPESLSSAAGYAVSVLSGTVGFFLAIFNIILIPVLMAYILMDYERMKAGLLDYLPRPHKARITARLGEVETVLRDFVKGQLLVALIMGVLYSAGLSIIGIDMPVLVGMASGFLNMVPYLGTSLGIVVAVALAALKFHAPAEPAFVLVLFAVVQGLEGYVITPKVVGERLGLHPLAIFLALVVFGQLMGFVGILLAVPLAAVLKVFIVGFLRDYKASRLYQGEG